MLYDSHAAAPFECGCGVFWGGSARNGQGRAKRADSQGGFAGQAQGGAQATQKNGDYRGVIAIRAANET